MPSVKRKSPHPAKLAAVIAASMVFMASVVMHAQASENPTPQSVQMFFPLTLLIVILCSCALLLTTKHIETLRQHHPHKKVKSKKTRSSK